MMDQAPPEPIDRRPGALGDLRVFPDELLCAILELLDHTDLGRLSCVSSVMYVLCNEEPLWMNLCLKDGGHIEYKGCWKKTALFRKKIQNEVEELNHRPLHFDGFNSLFLYSRWYRCNTTLDAFSLDKDIIERKDDPSLEEFNAMYDIKKPVLLLGLAKSWPAMSKWTIDQLLLNHGDVAFRISQRSSKKLFMKFKDYVSYMQLQHDEDPLYIFDDKFGEAAPALLGDYSVPQLFQEDFFDILENDERPPFRWLIIGPERSGASWHVDPALTSAWNTLLCGRKRWALYPPGRVPAGVTVHVNEEDGDVNVESMSSLQWWLEIYPFLADQDKPFECTQLPGETIFVPSGWWHCILNLEATVAVTQNFVNKSNFEFVCLDMAPGYRHKSVCRAGFLAMQENHSDVSDKFASLEKMEHLSYPDMTRREKRLRCTDSSGLEICEDDHSESLPEVSNNLHDQEFSYTIDFLVRFLDEDRDHYNSVWSPSNNIGQRDMREWLYKLWVGKPELRQLLWKGACISLNVDKWLGCAREICTFYNLPHPLDDERLPVGTGSNPVFLISDYVIKIYTEGGLESSIHGLGTELQFYSVLHDTKSALISNVPEVVSSGILAFDNGNFEAYPWDGKGLPDVIARSNIANSASAYDGFLFGAWRKNLFELKNPGVILSSKIWPYLITKRCKGDIFAHIRDDFTIGDAVHLASFLGDQLRALHLLPLPPLQEGINPEVFEMLLANINFNGSVKYYGSTIMTSMQNVRKTIFDLPPEWGLIVSGLESKRKDLVTRLTHWGHPIPKHLIEKVEEYIPQDFSWLFDLHKDNDGLEKNERFLSWIHSDIMDDNIYMRPCSGSFYENSTAGVTPREGTMASCNGTVDFRKWYPTHILDFSNLSIGDPLYDLIPIYLDVFRGKVSLLKQLLHSYNLPLAGKSLHSDSFSHWPINYQKSTRVSYRAMVYCIIHEENILGAIFSLWKELRAAQSWEEVEEAVWGEINNYQPSLPMSI